MPYLRAIKYANCRRLRTSSARGESREVKLFMARFRCTLGNWHSGDLKKSYPGQVDGKLLLDQLLRGGQLLPLLHPLHHHPAHGARSVQVMANSPLRTRHKLSSAGMQRNFALHASPFRSSMGRGGLDFMHCMYKCRNLCISLIHLGCCSRLVVSCGDARIGCSIQVLIWLVFSRILPSLLVVPAGHRSYLLMKETMTLLCFTSGIIQGFEQLNAPVSIK